MVYKEKTKKLKNLIKNKMGVVRNNRMTTSNNNVVHSDLISNLYETKNKKKKSR